MTLLFVIQCDSLWHAFCVIFTIPLLGEWLVTLPRFPQFWALVIYVFLSGSGPPPLLRLLALAWWFLLCVAPVNTGMVGYSDILGPLVIIALVLGCMHLAEKRASRQTKG